MSVLTRQYAFFISLGKGVLRRALAFVTSHPKLRSYIVVVLRKLKLYDSFRASYMRFIRAKSFGTNASEAYCFPCADIANLPIYARQIYAELKSAIDRSQKKRG